MRFFDQIDPLTLDRGDWQLGLIAVTSIVILATGLTLLMYPAVSSDSITVTGLTLRRVFFGFSILSLLLTGYLTGRHLVIRKLRCQLAEEEKQKSRLLKEASAVLLGTLPGLEHFQDRLAMEFQRAPNIQWPVSLLMVGLRPSPELSAAGGTATAFGDAAKALIRRLRREDPIYSFRPGLFAIILSGLPGRDADQIAKRLTEGLTDASGASCRFSFDIRMLNYPEHVATPYEMEQIGACCFPEAGLESHTANVAVDSSGPSRGNQA